MPLRLDWPAPIEGADVFITDGGLETTMIFDRGLELPSFAAFDLLKSEAGREELTAYYDAYVDVAAQHGVGLIIGSPTWRASPDWGRELGYLPEEMEAVNRAGVELISTVRAGARKREVECILSGDIGPRGDGYVVGDAMTAEEAMAYHQPQVQLLAGAGADLISAYTMTYAEEAIGLALAAREVGIPILVSFTVETDGRLPSGQGLREAIERVDAETGEAPLAFMVNCAHPDHFEGALADAGPWLERIGGLRANPSRMSHAELDVAEELDPGNPVELAESYRALRSKLPNLKVIGGCCGTTDRHAHEFCAAWDH